MINQQLIASIKSDIKEGESLDSIKKFLIESNVDLESINEALSFIAKEESIFIEENKASLEKKQNLINNQDINITEPLKPDFSVKIIDNEIFKYESKKLISHKFKANDLIPGDHTPKNIDAPTSNNSKTLLNLSIGIFITIMIIITIIYFYF